MMWVFHADPTFHFDADPDPIFHFDADPDSDRDPNRSFFVGKSWFLNFYLQQSLICFIFFVRCQRCHDFHYFGHYIEIFWKKVCFSWYQGTLTDPSKVFRSERIPIRIHNTAINCMGIKLPFYLCVFLFFTGLVSEPGGNVCIICVHDVPLL